MSLHNSSEDDIERNQKWIFYNRACKYCDGKYQAIQINTSRSERGPSDGEGFLSRASSASAGILCVFQARAGKRSTKSTDVEKGRRSGGLCRKGQAKKSARGMPWHQEPKKDVISCEKPRGAANELRSGDIRMGKPT